MMWYWRSPSTILAPQSDYYTIGEQDLIAIGKRLYRWLDRTDRWLAREFAAIGGGPVALLIQSQARSRHQSAASNESLGRAYASEQRVHVGPEPLPLLTFRVR